MLVQGVKEWFGPEAVIFHANRSKVEEVLFSRDLEFFYPGSLSSTAVYDDYRHLLGDSFYENFVFPDLKDGDPSLIICPECTFRVIDYIRRNDIPQGKIFYSQELLRNEAPAQMMQGKTRSFWQTGFEIVGYPLLESAVEAIDVAMAAVIACGVHEVTCLVSDKRILMGMLAHLPEVEQEHYLRIIDLHFENEDQLRQKLHEEIADEGLATRLAKLLCLSRDAPVRLDELRECASNAASSLGVEAVENIASALGDRYDGAIRIVPYIPKSWNACNSILFELRVPDYDYAVAGGGVLDRNVIEQVISGAGIGVTRITEYMLKNRASHGSTKVGV